MSPLLRSRSVGERFRLAIAPMLSLLLFASALLLLSRELRNYHYRDIVAQVRQQPRSHIVLAIAITAVNYTLLTLYDAMALRYIRRRLPYRRAALASFIGYVMSHNIGLSALGAAAGRYRIYSAWGLSGVEVGQIVAFAGLTFWLGFCVAGGLAMLIEPFPLPPILHLPGTSTRPLAFILLGLAAAYLLIVLQRRKPLRVGGWAFSLPSFHLALAQAAVSTVDWLIATAVCFVLLPSPPQISYPAFVAIFAFSQIAGMISHVPGGLGVFETTMILLCSDRIPAAGLLGTLLLYRAVYYLLPLGAAGLLMASIETLRRRAAVRTFTLALGRWASGVVPPLLALSSIVGGVILLLSGATPAVPARLTWVRSLIPLPLLEISHFLGSIAGIGLVLVGRGLLRRLDGAYLLTVVLLAGGIAFSLLKGLDYEEAVSLAIILIAFLPCHRYFYRKASLIGERFSFGWIAAVALVLAGSIWLGFVSYRHVEYSSELWWRFSLHGDAPRFLRASVGAIVVVAGFALARLLSPARARFTQTLSEEEFQAAGSIVERAPQTYANLVFLGDKQVLLNAEKTAFLMYRTEGRSWVSMGDPIGPAQGATELIWQFRELSDRYDGWTVFYEVGRTYLPVYIELGLTLLKIGEEARVRLEAFDLAGRANKPHRHAIHMLENEGCRFEFIPREQVPAIQDTLREVSDEWLASKKTREKAFSLGSFREDYIRRFPIVTVRVSERIVAFANVWSGAGREELSVDLMRYRADAPRNVMTYLFLKTMLWGRENGYRWFNLGMAPLAGLETHPLAPLWNRFAAFVAHHGEEFYNFQGIRQYKEKFHPEWESRYLVVPPGWALPRILANISTLISSGVRGVVGK